MMGVRLGLLATAALTVSLASAASGHLPTETGESAAAQPEPPRRTHPPFKLLLPGFAPTATPTPTAPPEAAARSAPALTLAPRPVDVRADGFLSWALLDRADGSISGSANIAATSSTESVIKIWLVADYLRRATERGQRPSEQRLTQARLAIRDSDDDAAQSLYLAGGGNAVVDRMISRCKLTDSSRYDGWWSRTRISARDAVRLGACVADGTAAGRQWTAWVLTEMTRVRGTTAAKDQPAGGRWGIIDGLPPEIRQRGVGLKNGWTARSSGEWHVNCLAVTGDWALAVLTRYPVARGLPYGARLCAAVTKQLVTDRS